MGTAMRRALAVCTWLVGLLLSAPSAAFALGDESFKVPAEDRKVLRRYYMDLAGRGPTEPELLVAAKEGRAATDERLLASPEHLETWYEEELYYFLLIDQFRPASEPVISIPRRLAAGELTVRDALQQIVIGQSFNLRNPGNDTFVTVVLEQILGITVQEKEGKKLLDAGKKMYDGYEATVFGKKGKNQADFVEIVFRSPEFAKHYLGRYYERLTGSKIAAPDLAAAAERFQKEPRELRAIVREWLLAPAYAKQAPRPKTDVQWAKTFYLDLLGRAPTFRELRDVRTALDALADSTPVRNALAKVVIDSEKNVADASYVGAAGSRRWVEEWFLLLLGRPATEKEVRVFVSALEEADTRVVLDAIVTSPEYGTY